MSSFAGRCADCQFFDPAPASGIGMCRRHAPTRVWTYVQPPPPPGLRVPGAAAPRPATMPFPVVSVADWCGEFVPDAPQ
jgi:hypothetical protein